MYIFVVNSILFLDLPLVSYILPVFTDLKCLKEPNVFKESIT